MFLYVPCGLVWASITLCPLRPQIHFKRKGKGKRKFITDYSPKITITSFTGSRQQMESLLKCISAHLELKPRQKEELCKLEMCSERGLIQQNACQAFMRISVIPRNYGKSQARWYTLPVPVLGGRPADPCCSLATQSIPLGSVRPGRDSVSKSQQSDQGWPMSCDLRPAWPTYRSGSQFS